MVQEANCGDGVVKSEVRKGFEVDYRLVNLRTCVQLGTHIRKGAYVEPQRDAGGRRSDSQSTESVCPRLREPFLCWSAVAVVVVAGEDGVLVCGSGADVKLLFGHLSDRRPRRLPVSVKSVRGRQPRRGLQAWNDHVLFIFSGKIWSTCLWYFLAFSACKCVATIERSRSQWSGQASRRSDIG